MTLRLFRCPSWLLLLRICWNTWRRSFLPTHYQTNLKLKAKGLLKYEKHLIGHQALIFWDALQIFDPSLQKEWSFPLRISSVYVTRSAEILTEKLHFLCVACPSVKYWKLRSVVLRNFMKLIKLRPVYELPLVPLPSAFIKQASFLVTFQKESNVVKENLGMNQYSVIDFAHYQLVQWWLKVH